MTDRTLSRTPQLDNDKIVGMIGDRFMTVIIAAHRARDLARQHKHKENGVHFNAPIAALLEIQEGKIDRDYLKKV